MGGLRDHGLTPLQQEMTVAAHLLSQQFDVTFSDIETGSGFDFLACRGDVELEVECKRVGVSLGRKIPRLETLQLHHRIHAEVEPTLTSLRCGLFLRVLLPERLTAHEDQHRAIASTVGIVFRTGVGRDEPHCCVEVQSFEIAGTPFEKPSNEAMPSMRGYIEERFGTKNHELMILGNKAGTRALVISIESRRRDAVLDRLFAELSGCVKNQFSKTRPGVLCVQFVDLTNEQIMRIDSAADDPDMSKRPSYLWRRTSEFLMPERRSHVLAIAFRGHGVVSRTSNGNVKEEGNAFFVTNENHPLAKDRRYAVFAKDTEPPTRILLC